jgi:perosamine synthetase
VRVAPDERLGGTDVELTGEVRRGGSEIVDALADDWRRLCDGPLNDLPFSRPEWVQAYFRTNTGTWVLFVLRRAGTLVALLPLLERKVRLSRLPATVLRAPSDFHLWPFDIPVAADVDRTAVAAALWGLVRRSRAWDVLELPNVPRGGFGESLCDCATGGGLPSHRWEYMRSPYVVLEGRPKDPLRLARSDNLRHNLKAAFRRIEREGGMRVVLDRDARPDVLHRFLELEHSSWKGRAGFSVATREKDVAFLDAVCRAGVEGGHLYLYSLEVGGQIVGVFIGLECKSSLFAVKMAWDEDLKRLSLGHVLVHAVLGDCAERGLRAVHLGGLRSAWKEQWTDQSIPHATHYLFRDSVYGRLVKRAQLRRIEEMIAPFSPRLGHIESSHVEAASRSPSEGRAPRIFSAPVVPGLKLANVVPRLRQLDRFPFNRGSVEFFYNARSAIYTLAGVFGLRGEEMLFPSYCCGVDLAAARAAGVIPRFYPVHRRMEIDPAEVVASIGPRTKAVYLIHYLGFPGPVEELSRACRERNVRLVEDCALSLFSQAGERPLGSFGDAAVFSLYKSLPVPSGGILVFNDGVTHRLSPRRYPPLRSTLAHLRLSLQRSFETSGSRLGQGLIASVRAGVRSVRPSVSEDRVIEVQNEEFDPSVCGYRMSRVSEWIIRSVDPTRVVEGRRANFIALNTALRRAAQPVFDRLPDGVCPLFYAVEVADNRAVMTALREKGIEAWAFWHPTPPGLEGSPFVEAQELRRRVVVIPCHEGIAPDGVARMVDAALDVLKGS